MPARLVIVKNTRTFHFEMYSVTDERILRSVDFATDESCKEALSQLKESAGHAECYIKKTNHSGQHYFVIMNDKKEILASSDLYWSPSSRDYSLMIVRRELSDALIDRF